MLPDFGPLWKIPLGLCRVSAGSPEPLGTAPSKRCYKNRLAQHSSQPCSQAGRLLSTLGQHPPRTLCAHLAAGFLPGYTQHLYRMGWFWAPGQEEQTVFPDLGEAAQSLALKVAHERHGPGDVMLCAVLMDPQGCR